MLFNDDPMRVELRTLEHTRRADSRFEGLAPEVTAVPEDEDEDEDDEVHLGVEAAWPEPEP